MPSKTSYFNPALFRKNLARFWPLWGGASFIGALFPLALLSQFLRYGMHGIVSEPLEMTLGYYDILGSLVPIICLLYGLLCALAVWGYLYNARSVNLMHILPIRREGLFVTNFLSGYVMLLLPFVVTGGLCIIISAAFGLFEPVGVLVTVLGVLGESFFYFSSATLAALITGNIFAMPALYLLLHFLEAILDLLLSNFARGFIFGLSTDYTGFLEFLSPTVYLLRNVNADAQYQTTIIDYTGAYTRELVSVRLENAWFIAVYALAGVVLLAFAFFGLGGYLFYAFLYGAMGALVSKTEDISKSVSGLMVVIMAVYFFSLLQLTNVDGQVIRVLSFLPVSSYSTMFARIAMGTVAPWEVIVSFLILALSTAGTGILGAKIYRMGTLRYGNPIKISTALKDLKKSE